MELEKFILVFLGSGLGGVLRYFISTVSRIAIPDFPLGTFLSNLLGMFLIGLFFIYLSNHLLTTLPLREFLIVGFLGGLTTFSSFGMDTYLLFEGRRYVEGFLYLFGNLGLGFLLLFLGRGIARP